MSGTIQPAAYVVSKRPHVSSARALHRKTRGLVFEVEYFQRIDFHLDGLEIDGLVPPRFGEAYRALIPGSRLVLLPQAGHAPFDEQADAFVAAFRGFLRENGLSSG